MLGPTCRILAAAACAAALLSFSTTAQAEERTSAPTEPPRTQRDLRALVVQGRAAEARAAIAERLERDLSTAERAATLELFAINESWQKGVPRAVDLAEGPPPPDWPSALELARKEVALGAYRSAARRLNALVGTAPNLVEAARAIELREIAREALARQDTPVEVSEPWPEEKPTPPKKREEWYGWQTLISDGLVIATAPVVPAVAGLTYLCGAPVVHLAHGNVRKAGESLGVRVGLPAAGGLAGLSVAYVTSGGTCRGDLCGLGLLLFGGIGVILGAAGAVAVDAAVLSYERVPDTRPATTGSSRPRYKVEVQPTAGPRREGGFDVGIGGTW